MPSRVFEWVETFPRRRDSRVSLTQQCTDQSTAISSFPFPRALSHYWSLCGWRLTAPPIREVALSPKNVCPPSFRFSFALSYRAVSSADTYVSVCTMSRRLLVGYLKKHTLLFFLISFPLLSNALVSPLSGACEVLPGAPLTASFPLLLSSLLTS